MRTREQVTEEVARLVAKAEKNPPAWDYSAACAEVMKKHMEATGNDYSPEQARAYTATVRARKAELSAVLLRGEQCVTIESDAEATAGTRATLRPATDLIRAALRYADVDASEEEVLHNQLKDGRKVSRVLAAKCAQLRHFALPPYDAAWQALAAQHPQFYAPWQHWPGLRPGGFRPARYSTRLETGMDILAAPYYQAISAATLVLRLSVDAGEFLAASENAAFSSCFRVGGEYMRGPALYAYSPDVIICTAYQGDPGDPATEYPRKVGRVFFLVDRESWGVVQVGRLYGSLTKDALAPARKYLQRSLESLWDFQGGKHDPWRIRQGNTVEISMGEGGYTDGGDHVFYHPRITDSPFFRANVRESVCLCCGEYDTYGDRPVCEDCDGGRGPVCATCGARIDEGDEYEAEGEYYCGDCFYEQFFYCHHCETATALGDAVTDNNGYLWCPECADSLLYFCEHCHEHSRNATTDVHVSRRGGTEFWCDGCISSDAWECDDCGEIFSGNFVPYDVGGGTYCPDCAEEHMTEECEQTN